MQANGAEASAAARTSYGDKRCGLERLGVGRSGHDRLGAEWCSSEKPLFVLSILFPANQMFEYEMFEYEMFEYEMSE